MTTFNYLASQATVDKVLRKFGQKGKILRNSPIVTEYDCVFVVLKYDPKDVDGVLILNTDRQVIMSAKNLAIEPNKDTDQILEGVARAKRKIITVEPISPAGTVICYLIQMRA